MKVKVTSSYILLKGILSVIPCLSPDTSTSAKDDPGKTASDTYNPKSSSTNLLDIPACAAALYTFRFGSIKT